MNKKFFTGRIRDYCLCVVSALLLVFSFPRMQLSFLAFVAFVPLMFALDGKSYKQAFRLSYFCGWLFFVGIFYWIMLVPPEILTVFGMIALVSYLSLYFAVWGLGYRFFSQKSIVLKLGVLPAAWVVLEYIRGTFLSGFGWGSLCHSQSGWLPLIQIADMTGMWGVSFFVMMANVFVKESLVRPQRPQGLALAGLIMVVVTGLVFGYGFWCLRTYPKRFVPGIKVALIQGNIAQKDKLSPALWDANYAQYARLTEKALEARPDLVVWPETSLPGYVNVDDTYLTRVQELVAKIGRPLLLGTVEKAGTNYYNVAFLFSAQGELIEKYRKLHLVPFGEFIPLRKQLPFISSIIPIGDFSSGKEYKIFKGLTSQAQPGQAFAVQICFEDSVPAIARRFVSDGAEFLINITNDAWFKDTKAPFLHLASSVFRSVETRRTLIRAANTGISCFIDPLGRIYDQVSQGDARDDLTFVEGYAVNTLYISAQQSFYARRGDLWVAFCGFLLACGVLRTVFQKKENVVG